HCLYHGYVEGYKKSLVALNLCGGYSFIFSKSGLIHFNNISLSIEPLNHTPSSGQHIIERLDKLEPLVEMCSAIKIDEIIQKTKTVKGGRVKRNVLTETKFIELLLIADNSEFQSIGSIAAIHSRFSTFTNIVDLLFRPLNFRVVLSHVEIWNQQNLINVVASNEMTLNSLRTYRDTQLAVGLANNVWKLTDTAMLITHSRGLTGIGIAFVSGMCRSTSVTLTHDFRNSTALVAMVMAHELGHNLGMEHDTDSCACSQPSCIMDTFANGSGTDWTNCSRQQLDAFLQFHDPGCLLNVPNPSNIFTTPVCGNGLVEAGEQCDCGFPGSCNTLCCNAATCMLWPSAQCNKGLCCYNNCTFVHSGTICRNSSHADCDLPEYCSGISNQCPGDFFRKDSLPCNNGTGVCVSGLCLDRSTQCQEYWGPSSRNGASICYLVNTQGERYAHC
uniref:Uncharacterized protein n=1 Tax=Ciona intestinalis TaxID=7719 RepID=H2XTH9_CIOIN